MHRAEDFTDDYTGQKDAPVPVEILFRKVYIVTCVIYMLD